MLHTQTTAYVTKTSRFTKGRCVILRNQRVKTSRLVNFDSQHVKVSILQGIYLTVFYMICIE